LAVVAPRRAAVVAAREREEERETERQKTRDFS